MEDDFEWPVNCSINKFRQFFVLFLFCPPSLLPPIVLIYCVSFFTILRNLRVPADMDPIIARTLRASNRSNFQQLNVVFAFRIVFVAYESHINPLCNQLTMLMSV